MKLDCHIEYVTLVFEDCNEATFGKEDIGSLFFSIDNTTYLMDSDNKLDAQEWMKNFSIILKDSANTPMISLTGNIMGDSIFTYIEHLGIITQIVINYGNDEVTYFVDIEKLKQKVRLAEDGLAIEIE